MLFFLKSFTFIKWMDKQVHFTNRVESTEMYTIIIQYLQYFF